MWRTELPFAVVDRHVTLKLASEEALVWVTDLRSGEPTASVEVRLLDAEATLLGAGVTDADGLARIRINPLENLWEDVTAIVGAPGAPGFGLSMSHWDQGASPWNFDIPTSYSDFNPYRLYLYSDRPIYRPGQTVFVRGVLREEQDVRYTLPDTERTVALALRDPDGQTVLTTTALLSEWGTFDAAFVLSSVARVGGYSVQATLPDAAPGPYGPWTWELPLTVAAYRKPEFEVTVLPERENVLQGETARALVEASYSSGGRSPMPICTGKCVPSRPISPPRSPAAGRGGRARTMPSGDLSLRARRRRTRRDAGCWNCPQNCLWRKASRSPSPSGGRWKRRWWTRVGSRSPGATRSPYTRRASIWDCNHARG